MFGFMRMGTYFSILWHVGSDLSGPGVDTSRQIVNVCKSLVLQKIGSVLAAESMMTKYHDHPFCTQLAKPCGYLSHGNMHRSGKGADLIFPGFAYVQHYRIIVVTIEPGF